MTIDDIKNSAIQINKKYQTRKSYATEDSPKISVTKNHIGFNAAAQSLMGNPEGAELYFVLEEQRVYVVPAKLDKNTTAYKFGTRSGEKHTTIKSLNVTTSLIVCKRAVTDLIKAPGDEELYFFDLEFQPVATKVTDEVTEQEDEA